MSILFSRQCEYALQAITFLALKEKGTMTSIQELTGSLQIPRHFLAKILQDLTHTGLVVSQKGPSGGFALGLPAEEMTLFHIVEAIDGVQFMSECVFGFGDCTGKDPCAAHAEWDQLRNGIYRMLTGRNVAQMAMDMNKPAYQTNGQ